MGEHTIWTMNEMEKEKRRNFLKNAKAYREIIKQINFKTNTHTHKNPQKSTVHF